MTDTSVNAHRGPVWDGMSAVGIDPVNLKHTIGNVDSHHRYRLHPGRSYLMASQAGRTRGDRSQHHATP
jgi:hypothetical protein